LSCPFFSPTERACDMAFPHPARLPLGAAWHGSCRAPGYELALPSREELEGCNLGYAHSCPRLPRSRSCDAVRFAIVNRGEGRVVLRFVLEANHLPAGSGLLEYDRVTDVWRSRHPEPGIQKLAECFLRSYLDRTSPRSSGFL
jgi:hypothetical protein